MQLAVVELSWEVPNLSRKNSCVGGTFVKLLLPFLSLLLLVVMTFELLEETAGGFKVAVLMRFSSFDTIETFSLLLSAVSCCFPLPSSASESDLWVLGSMPLCLSFFLMQEFHKFFISLSVLPGNCAAIWDHLIKQVAISSQYMIETLKFDINKVLLRMIL